MTELQDMLRVQARLHREQGANALGDLFENANGEIETLRTQLAKANARVEELQEALVDDSKAKTMLNKLAMENGELNIKASGNIFHVFCETFVETFKAAGATNYLVAEFNSEELGAFTVTMQRSEGLTVYQKLNEANERVKGLEKDVLEEIENRDNREEWLDKLSGEIARYLGVDIGEHSSAKNPWMEAFEAIPEDTLNKFAIEKKVEALDDIRCQWLTKASEIPLGLECRSKGSSCYNWAMYYAQELAHEIEQLRKEQE
ncbi:hypothetical protein ACQKDY_09705 [Alteromonas macleodii]|uniref:hypothetical protein n=1 Tax=Alteromonas macleodii TaxID=28108 RepID=UPI003D076E65